MKKLIHMISFILIMTVIFSSILVSAENGVTTKQPELQLGDYIVLGTIDEASILWRYVSQDENGILMLSDSIVANMWFGEGRNNCWSDSYIREWLNSSGSDVKKEWKCEATGDIGTKGFLHADNFTDSEKSVIKPVSQRNLLPIGFPEKKPKGGSYEAWECIEFNRVGASDVITVSGIADYDEIAYEILTDKLFCLDIKQMWDVYQINGKILRQYYFIPIDDSFYPKPRFYWLRTPYGTSKNGDTFQSTDLVISSIYVPRMHSVYNNEDEFAKCHLVHTYSGLGVRPAFYLNEDTMIILSGNGSKENPYVVDGTGEPDVTVVVNEEILTFDQPPVIQNDRTLVPLRGIFEAMGAQVDWEEKTKTITTQKDETVVTLQVDSDKMYVNGELVTLDVPAIVMNDRTLVPLRAISEAFGAAVEWEEPFRMATITS